MTALITGGTKGIGKELSISLARKGYDLFLVSRNENDLDEIRRKVPQKCKVEFYSFDLSKKDECLRLLSMTKDREDISILVNDAGFGDIGRMEDTSLEKEIEMIQLNDIACFILTKEFLIRFLKKNEGKVLNISSAAAFGVASYMNVYYASKSFVYSLSHGYYRELKDKKTRVSISVLCPGPVNTDFGKRANFILSKNAMSPGYIASYCVSRFLKGKFEIVVGFKMKIVHLISHFIPKKWISLLLNKKKYLR